MGMDNLQNFFKTNFALQHYHHWDLQYIDSLLPWERYSYLQMLTDLLKEEERKSLERQSAYKSAASKTTTPPAQMRR
jgi:hypothetical protein